MGKSGRADVKRGCRLDGPVRGRTVGNLAARLILFGAIFLAGCRGETPDPVQEDAGRRPILSPEPIQTGGLHNVYRLTERLYSGSGPEGDADFAALQKLGIKTVISVDGARPDVGRARKHGLRYVHLPIGYDGIPEQQALRIARAVRDLPGPVYLHCHHGKHRGPAAAAVARLCLDEGCGIEDALAWLRKAGTDPRYTGLYAALNLRRPTHAELDRVPGDFPETAEVADLAELMVAVDDRWEHLKQVRAAGWKAPPGHPDIDPAHEALQLAQHYRESTRLPTLKGRPEELRGWLADAAAGAQALASFLEVGEQKGRVDAAAVERLFREAGAACARCHAKYRDLPRIP